MGKNTTPTVTHKLLTETTQAFLRMNERQLTKSTQHEGARTRRFHLLLLLVLMTAGSLISFVGTFVPHQTMMSSMMGVGFGEMSFFWPMVFTGATTVAAVALGYAIAFPTIRYATPGQEETGLIPSNTPNAIDVVMRVSKPDERAVLEVLKRSAGVCLQKDIVYQTRLSKVKTHRIIARLAERGVVLVKKSGKTNEISIPAWLGLQSQQETSAPVETA
jgi:predicted transcriptional regulator